MSFDRKEGATILALVFLALAIRMAFLPQIKVLQPDETFYIGMAASMGEGRAYAGFDGHPFRKSLNTEGHHIGQPLVPLLFLAAGQVFGQRWIPAAQWTSVAAFLFTVFLFYAAGRRIGSKREAFFSTLLLVLSPFSIKYSLLAMTHSVYIFFLAAFFLCILKMLLNDGSRWAVFAGICLFGAYAARVEAFFLLLYLSILAMVAFFSVPDLRRFARPWMVGIALFVVFSLPLWIWIRQTTGIWQLDWDLSNRALSFMQLWSDPASPLLGIPAFYLKRLLQVWDSVMRQFPLPVWILLALGLLETFMRSRQAFNGTCLLLALCLFHFLFYPLFGRDLRFYHPAMLLLILMTGPGMTLIEKRIFAAKVWSRRSSQWFWGVIAALCLVGFLPGHRSLVMSFREETLEMRQLGEWIRGNEPSTRNFLGADRRPCFYAGPACGRFAGFHEIKPLPQDASGLEIFLRDQKMDFVITDTRYLSKFYPEYSFLLKTPPGYLQKVTQTEAWGERAVLFHYDVLAAAASKGQGDLR